MKNCLVMALLFLAPLALSASTILGSASNFSVLGASTITNTGSTSINGNIGSWPGTSITGVGTISLQGSSVIDNHDAAAMQAQADEIAAYTALTTMSSTSNLTGQNLGGLTLSPGVYSFSSSAQLTGTLTLNAQNLPNALFVFQIGTTLTTASSANVQIINGAVNDGVYFQVGSSATLGTGTAFAGNILALQSITLNTNAEIVCGRAFAQNGAVTMDTNVISNNCSTFNNLSGRTDFGSMGFSGGGNQVVPEPGTLGLAGLFLAGLAIVSRGKLRRRV